MQDSADEDLVIDSAGEHGLDVFSRNRREAAANGRRYGGVAIFTRSATTNFKCMTIPNPENFEVLCLAGKVSKVKEKVIIVAVYIPPNYPKARADMCVEYVADIVAEAKRVHVSPLIVVGGDWNQWRVQPILDDHTNMDEVDHGPTRGDRKIDRFLVNFGRAVQESDVLEPLDDGFGRKSDHKVA